MKTIIAGCRHIDCWETVVDAIERSGFEITEVVSGMASGVDRIGEDYAIQNGLDIKLFPAEWRQHGKAAGPIRNRQMAEYADALIAVWDGKSKGTANMIQEAERRGLKIYIHRIEES